MNKIIFKICIIIFSIIVDCLTQLPPDIERCHAGDVQCISRVASYVIAKYPNGGPDFGIPPFEPFRSESLIVDHGNNRPVNLRLELKNMAIHGLSKTKIERIVGFEKDPKTSKFELYGRIPKIRFVSNYKSDGQILVVPVHGQGYLDLNMTDVKLAVKFKPKTYVKNGKEYIDVDKIKVLIEPGASKINFKSSFGDGNPVGDSFNAFLNENWNELWKEIYPTFNEAILKIVKQLLQNTLKNVPYKELYLN